MDEEDGEDHQGFAEVPKEPKGKLVACRLCMLVKTISQFVKHGCDNCTFLHLEDDDERVAQCTTLHFSGLTAITEPESSWLARWMRRSEGKPGCYALSVHESLPEEIRAEITGADDGP